MRLFVYAFGDLVNRLVLWCSETQLMVDWQMSGTVAHNEAISYLRWVRESDSLVCMVLNKTDLLNGNLELSAEAEQRSLAIFAKAGIDEDTIHRRIRFFAVSAKTGMGIENAFRDVARELRLVNVR